MKALNDKPRSVADATLASGDACAPVLVNYENSLTVDVLAALDAVVLEHHAEGLLALLTPAPDWFLRLCPDAANRSHPYVSSSVSPFLENFLVDAELLWDDDAGRKYASEIWTETLPGGDECHLRAVAFSWRGRRLILLSEVGSVFTDRQAILQRAREGALHIHALQRAEQKLRESEAALARAHDLAVQAARLKSEFLANMSHEVRTPLNGVIGLADLLLDTPLNDEQRSYADTLQASAETLLRVVNDILDFSKIEAGKLRVESVAFDPRALVAEVVALYQRQAQAKKLELTATVAPGVPPAVSGDPVRLRQVLLNLTGNALKFTAQGRVSVSLDAADATLRFTVADTGPGLSREAQSALFRPFVQGDHDTARRYGGTGLGLAICKQLAELMGGAIGVESAPGQGARFWFTARCEPADEAVYDATDAPASAPDAAARLVLWDEEDAPATLPTARVLLVEDNPVNRRVAQKHLSYLGYHADLARDGHEAVAAARQRAYDLIFMDCQMAGLDGFAAAAAIRRHETGARRTPIVAVTSHVLPGDRERCLAAGMDDYLSKPVRRSDFAAMLARWLPDEAEQFSPAALYDALGFTPDEDPETFREVLTLFFQGADERLAALRAALADDDQAALKFTAHALRGSGSALGLARLERLCRLLEEAADGAQAIKAKALTGEIERELSRVRRAYEQ
jgi:signal transduction histidine kinase/CheY-like chemotaxis protein